MSSTDPRIRARGVALTCVVLAGLALGGCRQDMHDQPRYEPLEASAFFDDGMASRDLPEGTVARGHLRIDEVLYTGKSGDTLVDTLPMEVDRVVLKRGQERYDIFCGPCHGRLGDGQGMVVQRGFKQPASFHQEPLKSQPVGYYYDVITNGFGQMSSYASQVKPRDRWAIVAYIRALQLSQAAPLGELGEIDHRALESLTTETADSARPEGH